MGLGSGWRSSDPSRRTLAPDCRLHRDYSSSHGQWRSNVALLEAGTGSVLVPTCRRGRVQCEADDPRPAAASGTPSVKHRS